MLMKPIGRRHEEATRTPVDPESGLALLPEKRIAFAGKNHDVRTGSVPVSPWVSPRWILLEVRAHRIGGKVEPDSRGSLTSQAAVLESEVSDISDKIGLPGPVARDFSSLAVVIAFFAIESVLEFIAIAENKVEIPETIDHLRRVSERDKAGGLGSLRVEMLVPSV